MALQLRQLHPLFAAEASGFDMRRPLTPEQVAEVNAAMDRYAVLVFRGQAMEQEEQVAMARQFGPLNPGLKQIGRQMERMRERELIDISNLDIEGRPMGADTKKMISQLANQLWHSDSSFQSPAVSYSMLNCIRPTSWGGETEFVDLRAAWDTLPERLRDMVRGREAEHYALHSRITLLGDDGYSEAQLKALPAVVWPLVRVHPGSGRTALFCGIHARRILGMPLAEARMLLLDLLEHATRPHLIYTHEWQAGDLVFWDNRCTLHRGRRFDLAEPRELRRTTCDEVPVGATPAGTLLAEAAE
ncbi:MAG: TauD/TfdA family dioxygenase [Acetobacteraceae bacterium]|nr:TauD/TfdA family dioxygenase [Acetobacteraceae bacterium]